ncbi:hypothetical protein NCCP2716_28340 [Sporosarcina sp. NCCP-2716]|uniref:hypothetical protein n=1 Tax=Sporosarcina sp. NCCP-2716 TaxID=2943679 RepID=UPI00203A529B|nr:hypothetical protein [Sporosarcina sp. NCCP-2716]GKV70336.1 hypothetical protein NCCP2716_28340 [Sporosarcina sp. NCCP-2716]
MEKSYRCIFHTDEESGDIDIEIAGEGQEVHFEMAIDFFSVPVLFFQLARLWTGKSVEYEMHGFGMAIDYSFRREGERLLIRKDKRSNKGQFITSYDFNMEQFAYALDGGMKELMEKKRALGEFPLPAADSPHLLETNNVEKYEEFSALIHSTRKGKKHD